MSEKTIESFNMWINRNELKNFEMFLFSLELTKPQKIVLRFVDDPVTIFQEYETKLVDDGHKKFFSF